MPELTTVIRVKAWKAGAYRSDPGFLYIGRPCFGWPGSIWSNPFRPHNGKVQVNLSVVDRRWFLDEAIVRPKLSLADRCIDLHSQWIFTRPDLIGRLHELQGKRLGCWCHPHRCLRELEWALQCESLCRELAKAIRFDQPEK